MHSLVRMTDQY